MSAISDIREKDFSTWTAAEKCFAEVWEIHGLEYQAEEAAAELAALNARIEKLERIRIAALQVSKNLSKTEIIDIDEQDFNVWSIVGDAEKDELTAALKDVE